MHAVRRFYERSDHTIRRVIESKVVVGGAVDRLVDLLAIIMDLVIEIGDIANRKRNEIPHQIRFKEQRLSSPGPAFPGKMQAKQSASNGHIHVEERLGTC